MLAIGLISLTGLFGQRLVVIFFMKEVQANDNFTTKQASSGEINRSPAEMDKHVKSTPVSENAVP